MTHKPNGFTRRCFMGTVAVTAAAAAVGRLPRCFARPTSVRKERGTILSFYCDDTGPGTAGAKAFGTFLDYCAEQGIRGESSVLLGASGHSMTRESNEEEAAYLEQVRRAWTCGIDSHMEIMTHRGLFDFAAGREPDGVIHEGLWLHEPAVTVAQYEAYLGNIIAEGQRGGIQFTGLTWPGCGCAACTARPSTRPSPSWAC
jgi:hypothetical protein